MRALLLGLFDGPPASPEIRAELAAIAARDGSAALHAELARVDPAAAAKIDPNDEKRMIRALEVFRLTGEPMSAHQARHDHRSLPPRYPARLVGLAPEREALYRAIDARVDADDRGRPRGRGRARCARAGYAPPLRSQQAIGYAELHEVGRGRARPRPRDRADQKEFAALRAPPAVVVPRADRRSSTIAWYPDAGRR